jgi:hypothetical protein
MEGMFIWILLTNPELITDARKFILPETFTDQFSGEVYSILIDAFDENPALTTILNHANDEGLKRVLSFAYANDPPVTNAHDDLFHFMKRLQVKFLQHRERELRTRMKKTPLEGAELLKQIHDLITQRKALAEN